MDENELINKITEEVMKRLKTEISQRVTGQSAEPDLAPADLAKYIDHTMLQPDAPDAAFSSPRTSRTAEPSAASPSSTLSRSATPFFLAPPWRRPGEHKGGP